MVYCVWVQLATSQGQPSEMLQEEITYSRRLHLHESVTLSWLIVENTIISHTALHRKIRPSQSPSQ